MKCPNCANDGLVQVEVVNVQTGITICEGWFCPSCHALQDED